MIDVVWELRRGGKNRYKPLTKSQCEAIEKDYNFYTREKSIGKRTHSKRNIVTEKQTIIVDYDEEKMYSPHEGSIKRQFQKGLNYNFMKFLMMIKNHLIQCVAISRNDTFSPKLL